ncbi:MAG TPA: signal peptidase I [Ruminococcaceae bacterium]|nr:signal peptidase I [Oscillospiraceae bacterium]
MENRSDDLLRSEDGKSSPEVTGSTPDLVPSLNKPLSWEELLLKVEQESFLGDEAPDSDTSGTSSFAADLPGNEENKERFSLPGEKGISGELIAQNPESGQEIVVSTDEKGDGGETAADIPEDSREGFYSQGDEYSEDEKVTKGNDPSQNAVFLSHEEEGGAEVVHESSTDSRESFFPESEEDIIGETITVSVECSQGDFPPRNEESYDIQTIAGSDESSREIVFSQDETSFGAEVPEASVEAALSSEEEKAAKVPFGAAGSPAESDVPKAETAATAAENTPKTDVSKGNEKTSEDFVETALPAKEEKPVSEALSVTDGSFSKIAPATGKEKAAGTHAKPKKPSLGRKIASGVAFYTVIFVLLVFTVFLTLAVGRGSNPILGYSFFSVLSDSAYSDTPKGTLVIVRSVDPDEIEVGDEIAIKLFDQLTVICRVSGVIEKIDENGERLFETQGDENAYTNYGLVPASSVIGVAAVCVPGVGFFLDFISKNIWVAFVLLGLSLIVFFVLFYFRFRGIRRPKTSRAVR